MIQRRLPLAKKKPQEIVLPKGYKRVSYLESVDGAFIDLNMNSNNYPSFKCKVYNFLTPSDTGHQYFFGNNSVKMRCYYMSGIWVLYVDYNGGNDFWHHNFTPNTWHDVEFGAGYITLNGKTNTFSYKEKQDNTSLYLFRTNNTLSQLKQLRMSDTQAFEGLANPTIARNLICCVRESDGEGGYWDMTGSISPWTGLPFYDNRGSGHFIAGDEI